jgi:hypothetical protein
VGESWAWAVRVSVSRPGSRSFLMDTKISKIVVLFPE